MLPWKMRQIVQRLDQTLIPGFGKLQCEGVVFGQGHALAKSRVVLLIDQQIDQGTGRSGCCTDSRECRQLVIHCTERYSATASSSLSLSDLTILFITTLGLLYRLSSLKSISCFSR